MKTIKAIHFGLSLFPLVWITLFFGFAAIYLNSTNHFLSILSWNMKVPVMIIGGLFIKICFPLWFAGVIVMLVKKEKIKPLLRNIFLFIAGIVITIVLFKLNLFNWVGNYID